ncbi:retrovirus-related pol polyprotein from transposon TNT 1-94, partial [Tanacetum coccineum]
MHCREQGGLISDNKCLVKRTADPLSVGAVILEMNVRQNNTKKPNPKIVEAKEKKEAKALLKAPAKGLSEHTKKDSLPRGVVNQEKTHPAQEDNRDLNLSDASREGSGGDEATARFVPNWCWVQTQSHIGSIYPNKVVSRARLRQTMAEDDRRLSISEKALGAFGKSQTYSGFEARASRDKVVNMAAGDSDDALVCCVENTVEGHIMDSGASFHATYCKEELERFKLRSGKVRLADDKTLNIVGVGDVVLKTSFGTSWTLKDVRYIPGLKRRLILVGQLDKEGYHVGFGDQQWKVTKGSLVVAHGNKRRSLYMVKDWYEYVSFQRQRSRCMEDRYLLLGWSKFIQKAMALHLLHQSKDPATMIPLSKIAAGVAFGVAERLSQTYRAESMRLHVEDPKMLWADSVSMTYLIYCIPYVLIGLHIPEEEWRGKDTSLTHLKVFGCDSFVKVKDVIRSRDITFMDSIYEARTTTDSSSLTKPIQKSQVVLVDILKNLAENDNIVAEHRLSSKITQSLGGSSDTSEGSENNGSFENSGRLDEEYSEDGASCKEGGSETPQVRRSTRESRAPIRYSPSANYLLLTENGEPESYLEALIRISAGKKASQRLWIFKVKEEHDGSKSCEDDYNQVDDMLVAGSDMAEFNKPKWQLPLVFEMKDIYSEKQVLGYVLTVGVTTVEWESRLQKSIIMVLIFVEDSWNEEPCRDVHQVGDEREVEVLRSLNWPPSELITKDGVLPERGAIYRTEVCTEVCAGAIYPNNWRLQNDVCINSYYTYRELVSHITTPAEDNVLAGLTNYEVLRRSYQSLARSTLAQGELLKRFEHLNHDHLELVNNHKERSSKRTADCLRTNQIDHDVAQVRDVDNYSYMECGWKISYNSLNLEDWLQTSPPADVYVLG